MEAGAMNAEQQGLFEQFNRFYFGGRLGRVPISVVDTFDPSLLGDSADKGEYVRGLCIGGIRIEIHRSVAERHPGEMQIEGVLLHEMCHLAAAQERMRRGLRMYREAEPGIYVRVKHRGRYRLQPHGPGFHKYLLRLFKRGAPLVADDLKYVEAYAQIPPDIARDWRLHGEYESRKVRAAFMTIEKETSNAPAQ